jgi:hypothetical protein
MFHSVEPASAWRQANLHQRFAMTLRPEFALGHSEFNAFLFAPVGEDKAGLPLTVLSALSRLGLDPWGEAARLAGLPVDAAIQALTLAIARLPEGDWKASDTGTIAARLIAFLPARGALAGPPAPKPRSTTATATATSLARSAAGPALKSRPAFWLICLTLAVGGYMLVSHLTADTPLESSTITSTQE